MRANKRFTLVAITVMLLGGCGGGEESADDVATDAIGELDSAMSSISNDAGSVSIDVATREYNKQLDEQKSQLDVAKATAKTLSDDQLNKLVGNLYGKIADARSMLEKLTKADSESAAALQEELAGLMKELPALYDEIKTKIKVLGG